MHYHTESFLTYWSAPSSTILSLRFFLSLMTSTSYYLMSLSRSITIFYSLTTLEFYWWTGLGNKSFGLALVTIKQAVFAAMRHQKANIPIGVGLFNSAAIGAIIVAILARNFENPKAELENIGGNIMA